MLVNILILDCRSDIETIDKIFCNGVKDLVKASYR